MDSYSISIATANIHISDLYGLKHGRYGFDITFEKYSTFCLPNTISIQAGSDRDTAEQFLNCVKEYFSNAGICDGKPVAVIFSGYDIIAIGATGRDEWIDLRKDLIPYDNMKGFSTLGINIAALTVY